MTQLFLINADGTTTEIHAEGKIKDFMSSEQVYVIVSDEIRKIYLWLGAASNVRSKFIGAKRSQDIRGEVGMHYSSMTTDEGDEDNELLNIMGGRTEAGYAKEINQEPGGLTGAKSSFSAPTKSKRINASGAASGSAGNIGPLYTGQDSMASFVQDEQQINFEKIMQRLEEIKIPDGYERELIIIGNHAYSIVEKVQKFLGEKKVEKVIEKVGSIPEGVFFAEDYSPRILSESGKIIAIEFLKRMSLKRADVKIY